MNDTILKCGYPATLIREYEHWVVLLRPAQLSLGSLVLAARSDATDFGSLSPAAFAELKQATADIAAALGSAVAHEKLNYLMLMMVDPHVHFHVFPRYEGSCDRSEEHTSELQSLMRISYAVFCLKKKTITTNQKSSIQ